MSGLTVFLEALFSDGRVRFHGPPESSPSARASASTLLKNAFDEDAMDLAGPTLKFDVDTAIRAAEWSRYACWYLVSRTEAGEVVERTLAPLAEPRRAEQHLSADLTFRYLPLVHRRARAIAPDDLLTTRLADLFRRWPLSGVLSDVHDGPTSPLDFGGHPGLLMLYAERLLQNEKLAWIPETGSIALDHFERVGGYARSKVSVESVDD